MILYDIVRNNKYHGHWHYHDVISLIYDMNAGLFLSVFFVPIIFEKKNNRSKNPAIITKMRPNFR